MVDRSLPIGITKLTEVYDTKIDNNGYLIDTEYDGFKFRHFLYSITPPIKAFSYIEFKDCKVIKIKNLNNE